MWVNNYRVLFIVVVSMSLGCVSCGETSPAKRSTMPRPDPLNRADAERLYRHGANLAKQGDYIRAEQYMAAALERGYPEERVVPKLVQVCVHASRFYAGLKYARPYLDRHPQDWRLRYLVASLYLSLDDAGMARREFERVAHDAPNFANTYYVLSQLHRHQFKDIKQSRMYLEKYLQLEPQGAHSDQARLALEETENSAPGHKKQKL